MAIPLDIDPAEALSLIDLLDADDRREALALLDTAPPLPLMDFIPATTPGLEAPLHLKPIVDLIEATRHGPQEAVISTPPQHGKTIAIGHALVWLLLQDPTKRHVYASYSETRAFEIAKEVQEVARRAELQFSGTLAKMVVPGGGSISFVGIGGGLTGKPIDGVLVIDDPIKNREEAESLTMREAMDAWYKSTALTRCHPGASKLIVQTRWHEDDLAGRRIKRGFPSINLPATHPLTGAPLWPSMWPEPFLKKRREDVGEYDWASLYLGNPRPKGGKVFYDAHFYDALPTGGYSLAGGVDLAYSVHTRNDWSVAVVMARYADADYVLWAVRRQVAAPEFAAELRALSKRYPGADFWWYASTTEKGSADLIRANNDIPFYSVQARDNKFIRAQRYAARWNQGKILLPSKKFQEANPADWDWVEKMLSVHGGFTGAPADRDDDVDAADAAFDHLPDAAAPGPKLGTPEWFTAQNDAMREAATRAQQSKEDESPMGFPPSEPWSADSGW